MIVQFIAVKYWEKALMGCRVCDSVGNDCHLQTPAKGKGIVDTDFIFYISALQTDRCKKGFTVAYAAHCQQESTLDRPIAGHVNLCPFSISIKKQEVQTLLSTVKHEILHALGFSVSLYAYFRDDNGEPLTERTESGKPPLNEQLQARQWSDKIIKKIVRNDWLVREGEIKKQINMMVTPNVAREAKNHFDCPTLEGGELEDQGFDGTALTHWEKRAFENEAMTGTHTQNPVYSRITLALMEDTGWYYANYYMAQPLKWGQGLGCTFAKGSCMKWITEQISKGKSIHPYCNKVKNDPLETECTDDRNSVALCNLIEYPTPLPFHYQNFRSIPSISRIDVGKFGGSVSLADFCPYIQEFTWKSQNVIVRGSHCHFKENSPDDDRNFALEIYSNSSKCFNHESDWVEKKCAKERQWQHWGSGCYQYSCTDGRLHIHVANNTYQCFHENQVIPIKILYNDWLHEGTIICPPCSELCEKPKFKC
ncbi:Leishmanolysin-like peptidase [Armadillidium nasatum]|uniref:Leishmanolysin-like peptidase n=1 Tax=Armadillidium nasatum TaxID=96803 RepID=A0A5N5TIM4_9CRUS|nr:Leishmanolysin-like peptidase [Armadillidium nasatum]